MSIVEITRTLEKQLQLLSERSKDKNCSADELVSFTSAIAEITRLLLP